MCVCVCQLVAASPRDNNIAMRVRPRGCCRRRCSHDPFSESLVQETVLKGPHTDPSTCVPSWIVHARPACDAIVVKTKPRIALHYARQFCSAARGAGEGWGEDECCRPHRHSISLLRNITAGRIAASVQKPVAGRAQRQGAVYAPRPWLRTQRRGLRARAPVGKPKRR